MRFICAAGAAANSVTWLYRVAPLLKPRCIGFFHMQLGSPEPALFRECAEPSGALAKSGADWPRRRRAYSTPLDLATFALSPAMWLSVATCRSPGTRT